MSARALMFSQWALNGMAKRALHADARGDSPISFFESTSHRCLVMS